MPSCWRASSVTLRQPEFFHHTKEFTMTASLHTVPETQVAPLSDAERQRCEVWTRVMGYHRPVASFNLGKQGEFAERLHFREGAAQAPCHTASR
jgi:hypothetical protein